MEKKKTVITDSSVHTAAKYSCYKGFELSVAGYTLTDVVRAGVFIKNMNDFGAVNEVYAEYLGDVKPTRACVEVARLPKDVKVEIKVIAVK